MWATLWKIAKWAAVWELGWWQRRDQARVRVMLDASLRAKALGRPLLVIGAPDHGFTGGYPCGDMTADAESSSACPNFVSIDLSKGRLPLADNSVVVFVSCTLEYVPELEPAMRELWRVSGGEFYLVRVQPWTLTAYFYPGAMRTLPWASGKIPVGAVALPEGELTAQGLLDAATQGVQDTVMQMQQKAAGADIQTVPLSGFAGGEFSRFRYGGR
jgi:hypothetical protein